MFSGTQTLITQKQMEFIKKMIENGAEFIPIGNDLINVKSISRIGTHHATYQLKKIEENMTDVKLVEAGRFDLVDRRRKLIKEKTIKKALHKQDNFIDKVKNGDDEALRIYMDLPEEPKVSGIIPSDGGDYYLNEAGEKMYS